MILKEIVLGKTEEDKREVIKKNLGQQVILNDEHFGWLHGVLLNEKYDDEVYQMKISDGRGQRQFHYDDVNQLLVIKYNPKYSGLDVD